MRTHNVDSHMMNSKIVENTLEVEKGKLFRPGDDYIRGILATAPPKLAARISECVDAKCDGSNALHTLTLNGREIGYVVSIFDAEQPTLVVNIVKDTDMRFLVAHVWNSLERDQIAVEETPHNTHGPNIKVSK